MCLEGAVVARSQTADGIEEFQVSLQLVVAMQRSVYLDE